MSSQIETFAVYDPHDSTIRLTGLPPSAFTFSQYVRADTLGAVRDGGGSPVAVPVRELGAGLYAFERTFDASAPDAGVIYTLNVAGGYPASFSDQFYRAQMPAGTALPSGICEALSLYDGDLNLVAGQAAAIQSGAHLRDSSGATISPTVTDCGGGAYTLALPFTDASKGIAFILDPPAGYVLSKGSGYHRPQEFIPSDGAGSAPVVSNFVPALGSSIMPGTPLQFDVTVSDGTPLRDVVVTVAFESINRSEVVFESAAFAPGYLGGNSVWSMITGGLRIRAARASGWPARPTFRVHAVTTGGKENP